MTSGANLKKKRKAAKKKKKKQLSNKNKGEDDRKSEDIGDGDGLYEAENEECGSSSVGVDLDSESGDGSGNGRRNDGDDKELSVGDSGILRGLDHEQTMFVDKKESTQESVKPKDRIHSVAENVPIEVSNGNGLSEDTMVSSQLEHIRIEKSKALNAITFKDKKVSSVETPTVETEGIKEDHYTETSQNHANVPFARPMVQQTTWKCCCGLFEVFAGSNR